MRRAIVGAVIPAALLAASAAGYAYSTYAKWSSPPITIYINPANADLTQSAAISAFQYAMNVWSNAGSSFQFQFGGTASDTSNAYDLRNVVIFRNVSNGSTIATTYSWWNSSNQLLDTDIVVWDGGFTFYTGTSGCGGISNSAYLEDIATHELGHALGLNHSNFADATMYPSYSYCSQDMRTLAPDDVNGLQALYPGGASNTPPTVSITSPAEGASATAPASFTMSANATDAQGPVASVAFWANSTLIAQDTTSPFSVSWTGVQAGSYTLTAVATDSGGLSTTSSAVHVTVSTPSGGTNVAAASQGATITASSSYSSNYAPTALINGDRRGVNYGGGGVWHDATSGAYPDWAEIAFAGSKTIDQVAVFTVQDAWSAPSEPTSGMTWSQWGVNDFTVQYWTGSAWQTVPNGVVVNNNLVWRAITFPALSTTRIRVLAQRAADGWSRLTEVEAYQSGGSPANSPPSVAITSPASGTSAVAPASLTVTANATDAEGPVASVAFYANGSLIAQDATSPFSVPWNNVPAGSYTLTAVATDAGGLATTSAPVSISVTGGGSTRVNVAAASQGGTASASSSYNPATYNASAVINGDRRGVNYGANGVWHDATSAAYPDWVEIAFAGSRTIDEVDVFTVQDAWNAPSEPTATMTWQFWGLNDFTVQYWNGSGWQNLPGGVITNNNLVKRTITFAPLTTSRVRVLTQRAADGWSRLTEVEAYQVP